MHSLITPAHLVNSHTVDIIMRGAHFVLTLCGGSRGDVEVLLDVVHVVEGGHCSEAGGTGAWAGADLWLPPTLQTRLWNDAAPDNWQLSSQVSDQP